MHLIRIKRNGDRLKTPFPVKDEADARKEAAKIFGNQPDIFKIEIVEGKTIIDSLMRAKDFPEEAYEV
jgi:hypothetical protein